MSGFVHPFSCYQYSSNSLFASVSRCVALHVCVHKTQCLLQTTNISI